MNSNKISFQLFSSRNIIILAVVVVVFIVYGGTINNGYVLDSVDFIQNNPEIQKGIKGIPDFFTQSFNHSINALSEKGIGYRPLTITSFAIEKSLFGLSPKGSHFIQLLIYSLAVIVLYLTLKKIFSSSSSFMPIAVTVLFLVHPIHTEVINDVKNRDEILAFLGGVSSLFFMIKYFENNSKRNLLFSFLCYIGALLSKENALIYLIIIPLGAYYFSKARWQKLTLITLPYLFVSILIWGYNYYLSGFLSFEKGMTLNHSELINYSDNSMNIIASANNWIEKYATILSILWKHLQLLVFPHPLVHTYRYAVIPLTNFSNIYVWLTIIIFLVGIVYVVKNWRKKNILSFGILFYFISISFYSNLIIIAPDELAERYLFAPSLGFSIVVCYLIFHLATSNYFKSSIIAGVCLLLSMKTFSRNKDWKDNFTLFTKDIEHIPNCAQANLALGIVYKEKGQAEQNTDLKVEYYRKSIISIQESLKIFPEYSRAWLDLGLVYTDAYKNDDALRCLENAIIFAPKNLNLIEPVVYHAMSIVYKQKEDLITAIEYAKKAIKLSPNNAVFYNSLASYYFALGDLNYALINCEKAHQLEPDYLTAIKNLGIIHYKLGNTERANYLYKLYYDKGGK